MNSDPIDSVTRRRFLGAGGAVLVLTACGPDDDTGSDAPSSTSPGDTTDVARDVAAETTLTATDFAGLGTCVLLPESTAGPFPLDDQFDRRDITEGEPGHPVRLGFRVVDGACNAVADAAVEIWHTDSTGDYSAFEDGGGGKDEGSGTTFCRGTQTAGDDGIVEFLTIYPGWYRGRAVHIHLRVRLDGGTVLTSQVYFDEDYTAGVYAEDPYAAFGPPDTSNDSDRIAGDPRADGTLLHLGAGETSAGTGTLALLNLGIDA